MGDSNIGTLALRRLRVETLRAAERWQDAGRARRNADRQFRPIFVAGAIGSGTSLLAVSLAHRFAVAGVALESARDIARGSCLWIDRVQSFASVRDYEAKLLPRADWSVAQARRELQKLYRSKAVAPGLLPIVDKGPNTNLVRASFLAEAYPESPFLLIFRDPVANVEGLRRKWTTFGDDSFEESVRFWASIHERFLEQVEAFPERCITLEYEALVADYDPVLERLSEALGVPLADEPRLVKGRALGRGRGLRGVEGGRIGVVVDANARAYAGLEDTQIARVRERLSPLHERLRARALASGFALQAGPTA